MAGESSRMKSPARNHGPAGAARTRIGARRRSRDKRNNGKRHRGDGEDAVAGMQAGYGEGEGGEGNSPARDTVKSKTQGDPVNKPKSESTKEAD